MGEIVNTVFDSLGGVIEKMVDAMRTAFSHLIWEDPDATEKVLSDFAQFGLVFLGISIAVGIVYTIVRMVRV